MNATTEDFERGGYDILLAFYLADLELPSYVLNVEPDTLESEFRGQVMRVVDQQPERIWLYINPGREAWGQGQFGQIVNEAGYTDCGTVVDRADLRLDLFSQAQDGLMAYSNGEDSVSVKLLEALPTRIDGDLTVLLGWQLGVHVLPEKYSYALLLRDENEAVAAQIDEGLGSGTAFQCRTIQIARDGIPPGDYHLILYVYAWESGERLHPAAAAGIDFIELGRFSLP
jgi:hypothetical protein